MVACDFCKKDVVYPFNCSYCGGKFCPEHRLPEAHKCTNLPKESLFYETRMREEPLLPPLKREKPKPRIKPLLFACLLIFCALSIYLISSYGYASKFDEGYHVGYDAGYEAGYRVGYDRGYAQGNESGYEIGYEDGYNIGHVLGNDSGFRIGYEDGYQKGVIDGAGRGYNIRDPTYQEVLSFVVSDQTDKNQYNEETYTCVNFAADFKNNAFQAGYRCGYVIIEFPELGHAIVCFNTTERGLVFIEPQDDEIVTTLIVGEHYFDRTKYEITYDDTVVRFMIVW